MVNQISKQKVLELVEKRMQQLKEEETLILADSLLLEDWIEPMEVLDQSESFLPTTHFNNSTTILELKSLLQQIQTL